MRRPFSWSAWFIPCPYCKAPANRCCRTEAGLPTDMHAGRYRAAQTNPEEGTT